MYHLSRYLSLKNKNVFSSIKPPTFSHTCQPLLIVTPMTIHFAKSNLGLFC